jgi:hypothetical protein
MPNITTTLSDPLVLTSAWKIFANQLKPKFAQHMINIHSHLYLPNFCDLRQEPTLTASVWKIFATYDYLQFHFHLCLSNFCDLRQELYWPLPHSWSRGFVLPLLRQTIGNIFCPRFSIATPRSCCFPIRTLLDLAPRKRADSGLLWNLAPGCFGYRLHVGRHLTRRTHAR